jgi:antitoxin component YwqK of YwqJK toxin-antitoxin module
MIEYFDDGIKHSEVDLDELGNLDGKFKTYFKSGALQALVEYHKGKRNGKSTMYYEDGTIRSEVRYVQDVLSGETIYYDEKGDTLEYHYYEDGIEIE